MCNWSEGVIDRIRKEVTEEITGKVTEEVTERVTEDYIKNIMSSLDVSFEKACEILKLDVDHFTSL